MNSRQAWEPFCPRERSMRSSDGPSNIVVMLRLFLADRDVPFQVAHFVCDPTQRKSPRPTRSPFVVAIEATLAKAEDGLGSGAFENEDPDTGTRVAQVFLSAGLSPVSPPRSCRSASTNPQRGANAPPHLRSRCSAMRDGGFATS
jgi:hypothetical protein